VRYECEMRPGGGLVLVLPGGRVVRLVYRGRHKGGVRLGFPAPADVSVLRGEVAARDRAKGG
jgi:hypothetical protein